ncbi:MAG: ISAs1 family transposase [Planctomycetaceae bacterium]|nr:ISAs1 family transposase [Planctomycetaceae bacterium]
MAKKRVRRTWSDDEKRSICLQTFAPGVSTAQVARRYAMNANAEFMANAIRQHWGVENGLHWVMDMVFRDDECRIRKDNSPANFAAIKHMASNILRGSKAKGSMRSKRHEAAWDEDFLCNLVTT